MFMFSPLNKDFGSVGTLFCWLSPLLIQKRCDLWTPMLDTSKNFQDNEAMFTGNDQHIKVAACYAAVEQGNAIGVL